MTPLPIPDCVLALPSEGICIMADDPQNPPVPNPPVEPVEPEDDDMSGGHGPTLPGKPPSNAR